MQKQRFSGGGKDVQQLSLTCHNVDPKVHDLCGVLEILLFRLLRFTNRSGVGDTTMVLVQVFCDVGHVPLSKFLAKRAHELRLRAFRDFRAGHWAGVVDSRILVVDSRS